MRTYDLTPFWKSSIGFDRLFDLLENETQRFAGDTNYPPYNIERAGEDSYEVSLALAGFKPEEITITVHEKVLTVEGQKQEKGDHSYLYQGISARPFRREFNLAEYVEVKGAHWDNGMLTIDLVRELPEAMKPHRVEIEMGGTRRPTLTSTKKAA